MRAQRNSSRWSILRLGKDRHGSAAIEFALVAPAFIAFTIAAMEAPSLIFANMAMHRMSADIATAVRSDHTRSLTAENIRSIACNSTSILVKCSPDRLEIKVLPLGRPLPEGNVYERSSTAGIPDQIELRYHWNSFLPIAFLSLHEDEEDDGFLRSVTIVQPEPPRSSCPTSRGVVWC